MGQEEQEQQVDVSLVSDADAIVITQALDHWTAMLGRQYGPLSRPQRRMLLALAERQPKDEFMRVSELAESLGLSAAGATRMLDTLEGLGYLNRFRTPQTDQRQVYVQLTEAGSQVLHIANEVILQRVRTMLEQLSTSERATLAALLHKMVQDPQDGTSLALL